jgi:hypothetical protein
MGLKKLGKFVKKAVGGGAMAASKNMAPALGGAMAAQPKKAMPVAAGAVAMPKKMAPVVGGATANAVKKVLPKKILGRGIG